MRHLTTLSALLFLAACNNADKTPATAPLKNTPIAVKEVSCLRDSVCARIDLNVPNFVDGPSPAGTKAINDSLIAGVYALLNEATSLPLETAVDSALTDLRRMLSEHLEMMPDHNNLEFALNIDGKPVWQSKRFVSVEMNASGYTGGAHGFYGTALSTFDQQTGRILPLTELVSDTSALHKLLEQGFVNVHRASSPDVTLADLLLDPESPLPLPVNACVVAEGLRFVYNPYEVAPYAVGVTDILLTWQQLGGLSVSSKWID